MSDLLADFDFAEMERKALTREIERLKAQLAQVTTERDTLRGDAGIQAAYDEGRREALFEALELTTRACGKESMLVVAVQALIDAEGES